jgi:acylphosphatase
LFVGLGERFQAEAAQDLANTLGKLVRIRPDGSVEAVFTGEPGEVDLMIAASRKGPFVARVTDLEERDASADERALARQGEVFSVLPTA